MVSHRNGGGARRVKTHKLTTESHKLILDVPASEPWLSTHGTHLTVLRSGHPSSARTGREGRCTGDLLERGCVSQPAQAIVVRTALPRRCQGFHWAVVLGWRRCRSSSVSVGLSSQLSTEEPRHPKDAPGTVLEASRPH